MKKFCLPLLTSLTILSSHFSFALECPTINEIQSKGLSHAIYHDGGLEQYYKAFQNDYYKTSKKWVFSMTIPFNKASSKEDALNKAREALPDLLGEPIPLRDGYMWKCEYFVVHYPYHAEALTEI